MALNIPTVANQYSLRIPAHRFRQGERDVYYFALDLATLDGLLPQRVDDDVIRDANRRLTPVHAKNIKNYLVEQDDWMLGALMLGIAPDALEFDPYENEAGERVDSNFGELRILTNRVNTMRIFDGQHRRRAIKDMLDDLSSGTSPGSAQKLEALCASSMSIVLYAENDMKTLRQMFVDASKTKRIEANTVTRFDQRDPFNLTAMWLAEKSRFLKGRIEMERSSASRTSHKLMSINQLAALLKVIEVGYYKQARRELIDHYMHNIDDLRVKSLEWSDKFMPAAREEYEGLLTGKIENSEIPRLRGATFACWLIFIRLIAGCYNVWLKDGESGESLAVFFRQASIDIGSTDGLLRDAKLIHPDGKSMFSRMQEVRGAIEYIVRVAKASG